MKIPHNLHSDEVSKMLSEESAPYTQVTTEDGVKLFLRTWKVESPRPQATLIFHGITAHSKPYGVLAEKLNQVNFDVYGLDLRGHGLSEGTRGHYSSEEQLESDLKLVLDTIVEMGYESVILMGHSLGVLTCLKIMQADLSEDIAGLALFSAATKVNEGAREEPTLFDKIKIVISSLIRPSKPVVKYYREGMTGIDDPVFNFRYTLKFLRIFGADTIDLPMKIDVPLFKAIGDSDPLFSIEAARELFDDIHSPSKTFKIMPDTKHAVFGPESFDSFITWVDSNFE